MAASKIGSTFMERLLHCCTLFGYSLLHCCALLVLVVAVFAPGEWTTFNDQGVPVLNEPTILATVVPSACLGVTMANSALIGQLSSSIVGGPGYAVVSIVVFTTAMSFVAFVMYGTSVGGTQWMYYQTYIVFTIAVAWVAVVADAVIRKRVYRRRRQKELAKYKGNAPKKEGSIKMKSGGGRRSARSALLPMFVMMATMFMQGMTPTHTPSTPTHRSYSFYCTPLRTQV